jgi:hypothetical protein
MVTTVRFESGNDDASNVDMATMSGRRHSDNNVVRKRIILKSSSLCRPQHPTQLCCWVLGEPVNMR